MVLLLFGYLLGAGIAVPGDDYRELLGSSSAASGPQWKSSLPRRRVAIGGPRFMGAAVIYRLVWGD
ncbi:hypothetical protein Hesp01_33950 [Herbidospora sp. NBRC 101105]|nr:hypothetical protein Hesp01_33950 [Herbidospora sp. NBRC 101105]